MVFIGEGVDPHRKICWAIRNNFHTGAPMAVGTVHGDGLTSLQYRKNANGEVADGSEQTQLTHDGLNDWFPHISTDEQKIVLISFPKEVPSEDHPFLQKLCFTDHVSNRRYSKSHCPSLWRARNN